MRANYIYQTIHTLSHHPLHVAEHCRLLEESFLELYFRPLRLDEARVESDIVTLLRNEGVTREMSVFVELRVDIDQQMEIVITGVSLYEGYSLRCISPTAQPVVVDSPFGLYNTSARRGALNFAEDIARNLGGDIAIECNREGVVRSIDGASVFGLSRHTLIASPSVESVEREIVIQAAKILSLKVEQREIMRHELRNFDELFCCDHSGIIAIAKYDQHYYMSLIAEKIAALMTQPW